MKTALLFATLAVAACVALADCPVGTLPSGSACLWIAQDFASQGGAAELCGQVSGGRLYDGSLTDDAADVASLLPANTGLWSGFSFVGGIVVYSSNGQPAPLTADCPSDSDCEGYCAQLITADNSARTLSLSLHPCDSQVQALCWLAPEEPAPVPEPTPPAACLDAVFPDECESARAKSSQACIAMSFDRNAEGPCTVPPPVLE